MSVSVADVKKQQPINRTNILSKRERVIINTMAKTANLQD
jgi:hypothetical protein